MKQIETQDHITATADYVTKFSSEQTRVAKYRVEFGIVSFYTIE